MKFFLFACLWLTFSAQAQTPNVMESVRAHGDTPLNTNPDSAFWQKARPIFAQSDPQGRPLPEYRTDVNGLPGRIVN